MLQSKFADKTVKLSFLALDYFQLTVPTSCKQFHRLWSADGASDINEGKRSGHVALPANKQSVIVSNQAWAFSILHR